MVRLLVYRNVAPRRKANYNRNNHWQSVTVSKITLKKKWLTEPPKKVLEKSKSIQMRPQPQKKDEKFGRTLRCRTFFKLRRAKTIPSGKDKAFNGSVRNHQGFLFFRRNFFCSAKLKKGSAREGSAKFLMLFLRLWTHLDAFTFLQNLFGGFCQPLFFQSST